MILVPLKSEPYFWDMEWEGKYMADSSALDKVVMLQTHIILVLLVVLVSLQDFHKFHYLSTQP